METTLYNSRASHWDLITSTTDTVIKKDVDINIAFNLKFFEFYFVPN